MPVAPSAALVREGRAPPALTTPQWLWRLQQIVVTLASVLIVLKLPVLLRRARSEFDLRVSVSDCVVFSADAVQDAVNRARHLLATCNCAHQIVDMQRHMLASRVDA